MKVFGNCGSTNQGCIVHPNEEHKDRGTIGDVVYKGDSSATWSSASIVSNRDPFVALLATLYVKARWNSVSIVSD